MASEALLALGVVLAFVFGWNNSSFLIGNGEGSGSLTLREALIVSSAGLLLGVALEGSQMLRSLSGSVTPVAGDQVVLIALVVSLSMTIVLSTLKLPVSFSMAIVGAFAGAAYGSSLPLNGARLEDIATFWFLSPILAAVLAYAFYRVIVRSASRLSLLAVDGVSRYGVILTTLIIAYVLGANNIGLIYGMTLKRLPCLSSPPPGAGRGRDRRDGRPRPGRHLRDDRRPAPRPEPLRRGSDLSGERSPHLDRDPTGHPDLDQPVPPRGDVRRGFHKADLSDQHPTRLRIDSDVGGGPGRRLPTRIPARGCLAGRLLESLVDEV
jgi:hypothetical protein